MTWFERKKAAHAHAHQQRTRTRNSKGRRVKTEEGRRFEQKNEHVHEHQLRTRAPNVTFGEYGATSFSVRVARKASRHIVASISEQRESWFVTVFRVRFGCTCACACAAFPFVSRGGHIFRLFPLSRAEQPEHGALPRLLLAHSMANPLVPRRLRQSPKRLCPVELR